MSQDVTEMLDALRRAKQDLGKGVDLYFGCDPIDIDGIARLHALADQSAQSARLIRHLWQEQLRDKEQPNWLVELKELISYFETAEAHMEEWLPVHPRREIIEGELEWQERKPTDMPHVRSYWVAQESVEGALTTVLHIETDLTWLASAVVLGADRGTRLSELSDLLETYGRIVVHSPSAPFAAWLADQARDVIVLEESDSLSE